MPRNPAMVGNGDASFLVAGTFERGQISWRGLSCPEMLWLHRSFCIYYAGSWHDYWSTFVRAHIVRDV